MKCASLLVLAPILELFYRNTEILVNPARCRRWTEPSWRSRQNITIAPRWNPRWIFREIRPDTFWIIRMIRGIMDHQFRIGSGGHENSSQRCGDGPPSLALRERKKIKKKRKEKKEKKRKTKKEDEERRTADSCKRHFSMLRHIRD